MSHNEFKYPKESLFYIYPEEQVKKWIYNLKYFVFQVAQRGHGSLDDRLETFIECADNQEFLKLCSILRIPIDHFDKIETLRDKRVKICGYNCFVRRWKNCLNIDPCHNWKYTKDDNDYEACILIEKLIDENNFQDKVRIDHLKESSTAITKEKYKDYFKK